MKALLAVLLCSLGCFAQSGSPYSNNVFPAQSFTATAQTGAVIQLNGQQLSYGAGTISLTGTSLTTATFSVQGSSDNGVTFYALPISAVAAPGTIPTTTVTATASGLYQISLVGITHVKFVTSGTFTATSVSLVLTATPNFAISRNSSSGGALPAGFTANTSTGIFTVPNGYAISSGQQVVNNYTAGTTPTAPPASTIQFGAPATVPSSYTAYLPSAAPTDATGDVPVWPQGGGTATWKLPAQCSGTLIQSQTVGSATASVTFSSIPQQFHHLKLLIGGLVTTGNTSIQLNFNGDVTTGDYNVNYIVMAYTGTVTGAGSFGSPGAVVGTINPGWGGSEVTIYNYSSAAGAKFYTAYGSSWQLLMGGGEWNSNNPLTSIAATIANGTTWGAGSTLSLCGVI